MDDRLTLYGIGVGHAVGGLTGAEDPPVKVMRGHAAQQECPNTSGPEPRARTLKFHRDSGGGELSIGPGWLAKLNPELYRKRLKQAFLLAVVEQRLNDLPKDPKRREGARQTLLRRRNSIQQGVIVELAEGPDWRLLAEEMQKRHPIVLQRLVQDGCH
ncbi:unnamed protein product [Durusdinium trenchii]|uniref:Uncharacterized protein n=1 Tax=Durusdinium trenchii TaxID=1381693 RepID=A0ABP0I480_9DINO